MSGPSRSKCLVDGCDRLEELASGRSAGGLCAGHRKRKVRGLPIWTPLDDSKAHLLTPGEMLVNAALSLADVDPTDNLGWFRALDRQRKAAVRYAKWVAQQGWELNRRRKAWLKRQPGRGRK